MGNRPVGNNEKLDGAHCMDARIFDDGAPFFTMSSSISWRASALESGGRSMKPCYRNNAPQCCVPPARSSSGGSAEKKNSSSCR